MIYYDLFKVDLNMSVAVNKLEALTRRIQEIKDTQDLVSLIDSMGFFAITQLLKLEQILEKLIPETEAMYSGGVISSIQELLKPKKNFRRLKQKVRPVFVPA